MLEFQPETAKQEGHRQGEVFQKHTSRLYAGLLTSEFLQAQSFVLREAKAPHECAVLIAIVLPTHARAVHQLAVSDKT